MRTCSPSIPQVHKEERAQTVVAASLVGRCGYLRRPKRACLRELRCSSLPPPSRLESVAKPQATNVRQHHRGKRRRKQRRRAFFSPLRTRSPLVLYPSHNQTMKNTDTGGGGSEPRIASLTNHSHAGLSQLRGCLPLPSRLMSWSPRRKPRACACSAVEGSVGTSTATHSPLAGPHVDPQHACSPHVSDPRQ